MIEMKVGIIGGSDGLGKTLIYFLRDDFDVIISARDHKKGRKIANELGISKNTVYLHLRNITPNNQ